MVYEIPEGDEPVTPARPLILSTTDEWLARISDQLDQLLTPSTGDQPDDNTEETVVDGAGADPTPDAGTEPVLVEEPQTDPPKRRRGLRK